MKEHCSSFLPCEQKMATETQLPWSVSSAAAGRSPEASAKIEQKALLEQEGLRGWGILSVLSLADQGLTSGAGFGVNLLLARWMPAELYGAFATAFACFLFVSGFHNVLLLEPMSVFGPSQHADGLPEYFRAQIAVHALLVGGLSIVAFVASLAVWSFIPNSGLIGALLGSSLTLPFLLLQWLARRMCYVTQRPSIAVIGSGFYLLFTAAGLFALRQWGQLTPFTTFVLMGLGSALAAAMVVWRLGLFKRHQVKHTVMSSGLTWRTVLQENWKYGRWLVGSAVLWLITGQAQMFLVAAVLGLGAAGVLRAMQLPSLAMTQVITAAGLLALPALSREFGKGLIERLRHKAMLASFILFAVALCVAAVLMFLSGRVERLLFGGRYAAYAWLIPVLGLMPVCTGFSTGYSMAMRAMQRPHLDLIANGVAAPVGVLSALAFIRWWGIAGAAVSMVASLAAYSFVYWFSYRRSLRPWKGEKQ